MDVCQGITDQLDELSKELTQDVQPQLGVARDHLLSVEADLRRLNDRLANQLDSLKFYRTKARENDSEMQSLRDVYNASSAELDAYVQDRAAVDTDLSSARAQTDSQYRQSLLERRASDESMIAALTAQLSAIQRRINIDEVTDAVLQSQIAFAEWSISGTEYSIARDEVRRTELQTAVAKVQEAYDAIVEAGLELQEQLEECRDSNSSPQPTPSGAGGGGWPGTGGLPGIDDPGGWDNPGGLFGEPFPGAAPSVGPDDSSDSDDDSDDSAIETEDAEGEANDDPLTITGGPSSGGLSGGGLRGGGLGAGIGGVSGGGTPSGGIIGAGGACDPIAVKAIAADYQVRASSWVAARMSAEARRRVALANRGTRMLAMWKAYADGQERLVAAARERFENARRDRDEIPEQDLTIVRNLHKAARKAKGASGITSLAEIVMRATRREGKSLLVSRLERRLDVLLMRQRIFGRQVERVERVTQALTSGAHSALSSADEARRHYAMRVSELGRVGDDLGHCGEWPVRAAKGKSRARKRRMSGPK